MNQVKKKKNGWKKPARIAAKSILYIILFLLIVVLLVQTPPVQNMLKKRVVAYLEKKLETRIEVGRIYIGLPKNIVLEDIYVEDRFKDTLLSGGSVKANLDLWQLAFNNEVDIKSIAMKDVTAKIKRQLPDTTFNFQFIVDAFATKDTVTTAGTTTSSEITIRSVVLDNIRITYNDVITGSDMEGMLGHLDTRIDKFDPAALTFDVPHTNISDLTARIYQVKPLASPEPPIKDLAEAANPMPLKLDFNKVNLDNVKIEYRNDVSAAYATLDIGSLNVVPGLLDFSNKVIYLNDLSLHNSDMVVRVGKKETVEIVAKEAEQEVKSMMMAGWRVRANSLDIVNNSLQFDDDNAPPVYSGMDYGHLDVDSFTLQASNVIISNDSIAGRITNASFREKSGFVLNKLETEFLYTKTGSYLKGLYLETPGTELKRSAEIRYASIESLSHDIGNMEVDLDLEESKLLVKDLLVFAPQLRNQPAFAWPEATWYINSRITGRVADLQIDELQIQGLSNTRIDIAGSIGGLPDMKNMRADLAIRTLSSTAKDINLFVPKNAMPRNITLPGRFNASGTLKGNAGWINTDILVTTDLGNASVKGLFSDPGDPLKAAYDATIQTRALDIGTIFQNRKMLGPVTATIAAKGKGFDPAAANASFNGVVQAAMVNRYIYRNLKVKGSIAGQKAIVDAVIADPNIHFALNGQADLSTEYPAIKVSGMIDSIKLEPLHLATNKMIYRGKIDADFPVTNPDDLQGSLFLTQSLFVQEAQRMQLDTVKLVAGRSDSGHYINLESDVMVAKLEGQYRLTQLGNIFQQAIQPYFAVAPGDAVITREPYDFTLNAHIIDNPALKIFIPNLERIDSVSIQSHFSDRTGWNAVLKAPALDIGPNHIRNLQMTAGTGQKAIVINANVEQFSSGKNIKLDNTSLTATLANNTIDFRLNTKDKNSRDKYNIKGLLQQPRNGNYQISLHSDSLVLNYDRWAISENNRIVITPQGVNMTNVVLSKNGQQLAINSVSNAINAPLEANFTNFQLATLAGFVQTDSTFANGVINGKITFADIINDPVFAGDLTVSDFVFKGDTVGNIRALVNNRTPNTYATDITLSGRGNDVKLTGNYFVRPGNSNFDFDLDIRSLSVATAQAFASGGITGATGSVNGKFDLTGTFQNPKIRGDLKFDKAGFNIAMINSYFTIDNESIRIDDNGIRFNRFEIKDSLQNSLFVDGIAATSNFTNYRFDLRVNADNFKALNSTKKNNSIFYGQLYFGTNLLIKGTESAPLVDGRLVINENTELTVVLPQKQPGVIDREGIVEFVNMDAPMNDSLFMAVYDSLNTTPYTGMDISLNIEIVRQAEFNIIIDEGNGDFLNVKGQALLTGGIDPSGRILLSGSYELDEGAYELTFNFLRRRFEIEKGSRIVWEGEPTTATVDVEAIYVANAAPLDLVKDQLGETTAFERNTYLQKLPFDVHLDMEGQLLQPQITFDIVLPEDKSYAVSGDIVTNVRTRLDQLRQEPGEMNKQVFSLLLLNRFLSENPFHDMSGPNAAVLARQSVSKLLTEQLNRMAGDLIAGVDLNFDVLSSEDYTTGERRDRTDLNVKLSKQLLNDRLTVTIGSNFELEGPQQSNQASNIAGDIALDYRISKDNRYLLRAYRKNEYEGIIDGYIIETGVGFIITVDYNNFRQIFMSRRDREQRRILRRQRRELEEQQRADSTSAQGTVPVK